MPEDDSQSPLLTLIDQVRIWVESMETDREFRRAMEHRLWTDELREKVKQIIVWLELNKQSDAAACLDDASCIFRSAFIELTEIYNLLHQPEDPRCREALDKAIDAVSQVSGVAEDLLDELPVDIWEGFSDA